MAYIHASPTTPALIQISTGTISSTSTGYMVPSLTEITVNASNGEFRWQELGENSERVVTTPSTNNITANIVIDDTTFFSSSVEEGVPGIFKLSEDKTKVYFRVYLSGYGSGKRYIEGEGFLSSLAPTVSPTAPVWQTNVSISVDGELTSGTV